MNWRQNLPIHLSVLSYARDFIGIREVGGDNYGPAVEWFQKLGEISPGQAWCCAFVNAMTEIGCAVHNVRSPLEKISLQGYVQSYYEYASSHGWLVEWEDTFPGVLFVKWFGPPKSRWAHIGFMDTTLIGSKRFRTVEGNSNDEGSAQGYEVAQNWRTDRQRYAYIDWTRGLTNAA